MLGLFGLACAFDSSGGVGGAGSTVGDTGSDSTAEAGSGETSATATSPGSADGEGDAGPSTTASTSGGMSTSASTTMDPSGPSTGTADSAGEGSTTATSGAQEESTGGAAFPYPPCPSGDDADCPAGYNCIPIFANNNQIIGSYCGDMDCFQGVDCPLPGSGTAVPACLMFSTKVCSLPCDGLVCPDGMDCIDTDSGWLCVWPN